MRSLPCGPWVCGVGLPGGPAPQGRSLRAGVLEGPHGKEARNGAETRTSQGLPLRHQPPRLHPHMAPGKNVLVPTVRGVRGRYTFTSGEYNSECLLAFTLCQTLIPGLCVPAHGTHEIRGGGGPGGDPACPPPRAEPEREPCQPPGLLLPTAPLPSIMPGAPRAPVMWPGGLQACMQPPAISPGWSDYLLHRCGELKVSDGTKPSSFRLGFSPFLGLIKQPCCYPGGTITDLRETRLSEAVDALLQVATRCRDWARFGKPCSQAGLGEQNSAYPCSSQGLCLGKGVLTLTFFPEPPSNRSDFILIQI